MSPFWQEIFENPRTFFGRLERGQKLVVIALASVCLTAMGLGAVFASRPTYVTLFAGLDREDGSRVVSQLESDGVPYQVAAGGDRILVEEEQVDEIRLKLAGSGLPSGGIGYEIFNDQQLGLTDALFSVNVQRALQGELERIIQITPAVSRARVLIDLPEKSGYLRPNRKPSASVTVDVRPGLLLSDHNIYAIAHLVAAAIGQGMQATEVTIVDSQLNHLHPPGGGDDTMLSTTYLQSIARIESHLQRKAESQLEDAIGPNKATWTWTSPTKKPRARRARMATRSPFARPRPPGPARATAAAPAGIPVPSAALHLLPATRTCWRKWKIPPPTMSPASLTP
jgi:flagellar M-ring protein FliF